MNFLFKPVFQKAFAGLDQDKQRLVLKALEALEAHFQGGTASYGLRVKKLHQGKSAGVFEARVSSDLRMVWVKTEDKVILAQLGNHEDVRRFLKSF